MAHTEVDFTYQEALQTMGLTPEKLDKLIDEGKIPVINTGYRTLVSRESVLGYMQTVSMVGKDRTKKAAPAKEAAPKEAAAPAAEAATPDAEAAAPTEQVTASIDEVAAAPGEEAKE